jgi:hypothetical protein
MSEVSRPLQVVLVLALAFAGLWFVALRPKPGAGRASATQPATTHPAQPAPKKSSLPGGLGRSVDKANATKRQGDAAAAAADRTGAAPESGTTSTQTPPASGSASTPTPAPAATGTTASPSAPVTAHSPRAATPHLPSVTPGMVRHALARGDVVALLFWGSNSADDRAVRSELARVDSRGGHVHAWPVAVRGLSRFKNVLRGIDVLQSPSVVILARGADPRVLAGYTDHAEIDQATLIALSRR